MPKKNKPSQDVRVERSGALTHSPFAVLGGSPSPSAPVAPATQPASSEPTQQPARAARGRLVLRRETRHRGGKTAIIIAGFERLDDLREGDLDSLARDLKRSLACGGSLEGVFPRQEIVLQGDQPAKVAELLRARGFQIVGVLS